MRYRARAPLRIDFGGGWTDVPFYAEVEGGAVLNAAITRYATGFIARPEDEGPAFMRALRGHRSYTSYTLDLPAGAGLGASAAQTVLWVALLRSSIENVTDRREIAEMSCGVAAALGILGGKQDEYASALGGITYFTFGNAVQDERLALDSRATEELLDRLVLVYSGKRRLSSSLHESVWFRYRAGDPTTVRALADLKRVAGEMKDALLSNNLDAFGNLIHENWVQQKVLEPTTTNDMIESIIDIGNRHGAVAAKACGAGGGGCVLLYAAPDAGERLRTGLAKCGIRIIDFEFDSYGVYLTKG